ncbi:MAG: tetratricopeptide repeat protein [Planctomycetes bacterium]|nr:tetratricopeptide repeat protein [Planctomycetota bacterium]
MRWSNCVRLVALIAILSRAVAPAQDLGARQQEFMTSYRNLVELQDLRGIGRLASKDKQLTEDVLLQYSFRVVRSGADAANEVDLLITAADESEQGTRFRKRFDRFKPMDAEARGAWLEAWNAWAKASNIFAEATTKREQSEFRRALVEMTDALTAALKANDPEMAAMARYHVGYAQEQLGEYAEVIKAFDVAMDEWVAAGRPKEAMYQYMVDKRRELIDKGHDPLEAGKAEPGPKKNATTSYREGSAWVELETAYKEMKEPAQFASTTPWGVDNFLLWREFGWSDKKAHEFGVLVQAAPFGKPLKVFREGGKGWFDLDEDGKEGKADAIVKVIDGKPTLNSLKAGPAKDADRYAFYMLSGGQGQQWFGTLVNYQTSGRYRIGCYREVKVEGEPLVLIDDNCTGSIGDPSDQGDNIWRGNPRYIDNDALVVGKGKVAPWSDIVSIAGRWWNLKVVDPHAKKIRLRELDLTTGQVVVKWNGPVAPKVLAIGETEAMKGAYFDVAGGAPVTVPAGRYEIAYGRLEAGKPGQMKQAWIFKGESGAFDVKPGEVTTLDLGGPYTVDFKTEQRDKALVILPKTLLVKEKSGAIIGRIYDEIPYYEVAARKRGGGALGKPKAMSKISTETFNSDNSATWFPAEYVIDHAKEEETEIQLTLKKHSLLGGPITSEWK